ncbi:MAG: butyrate kinase, partial [Synergistetes bacterium]|nr:butyrate kinase [Synergistota bacterium]
PVSVDELEEVARFTGLPFIKKRSLFHALNIRAVARKTAEKIGRKFEEANFVIAHLGGGISVVAIRRGKAIDVNNANEMGPFSPERTGGLPPLPLVRLAVDKGYTFPEVKRLLAGNGGVKAYLGIADLREVRKMIEEKDTKAELVYKAMIYQIAKEIGSMYASLQGKVDAIAITGGIAHDDIFVKELEKYIDWMAKIFVFEGEFEMEALALGALRVLKGEEKAKHYKEGRLS